MSVKPSQSSTRATTAPTNQRHWIVPSLALLDIGGLDHTVMREKDDPPFTGFKRPATATADEGGAKRAAMMPATSTGLSDMASDESTTVLQITLDGARDALEGARESFMRGDAGTLNKFVDRAVEAGDLVNSLCRALNKQLTTTEMCGPAAWRGLCVAAGFLSADYVAPSDFSSYAKLYGNALRDLMNPTTAKMKGDVFTMARLTMSHGLLRSLDDYDYWRSHRAAVLVAVRNNGLELQYASEPLRNDVNVVKLAVSKDGWALQYASEPLQNDVNVVKLAVSNYGSALKHASKLLQNDENVVKIAVSGDGVSLEFASEKLKNDKLVVMIAVKANGRALVFASDTLQNDKELIRLAT